MVGQKANRARIPLMTWLSSIRRLSVEMRTVGHRVARAWVREKFGFSETQTVRAQVLKSPQRADLPRGTPVVFLAGAIDMGDVEDWQRTLSERLSDLDLVILNPRRDHWDPSWKQSIQDPNFREQVEWELDGLDRADVIAMWFASESKAPITLLELGLHARSGKLVIGCPQKFWRRGNIEVLSARHHLPLLDNFDSFVEEVRKRVR